MTDSKSTVTRLGGQTLYFLLGNIFTLFVGFPLQVFVARTLGAENLGIFSLFDAVASLGANLLSFGLAPTLVKFIPHNLARGDQASVRLLVNTGFKTLLLAGGGVALGVWLLQILSVPLPLVAHDHESVVSLMALLVPLLLLNYFFQQGLRGFQEFRYLVMGTSFLQLGTKTLLTVALLSLGAGLTGYVAAVVLASMVSCAWLARGLKRRLDSLPPHETTPPQQFRKEWRDYATIWYLHSLIGVITLHFDRFLLGWLSGAAPVGVLLLVKQLNEMPGMFFQMFISIASPMFASAHARDDARERQHLFHLLIDWVLRLSAPLCLFLLLFAEGVLGLYGGDIAEQGSLALRVLIAAQLVNLAMGPLGNMLTLSGSERLLIKLTVADQLVWGGAMLLVVPTHGLNGLACVTALSILEHNFVLLFVAKQRLGIRWFDKRFLRWLLPSAVTAAFGALVFWRTGGALSVVELAGVLISFYLVFFSASLLQGMHDDDKTLLSHVFNRLTGR